MSRADANGSKKHMILDCLRPRKLSPHVGANTIFGLWPFAEKAPCWDCFGPSFWSLRELHAQKTRFLWVSENCLIFESIFKAFGLQEKSVKNRFDPRGHLGPRWLQGGVILSQHGSKNRFSSILDGFLIDFAMDFSGIF